MRAVPALVLILVPCCLTFAQGFQGGLRSSVKDADGVAPNVVITITNVETNISRTTTTNDEGEYAFPALEAGVYKLHVSKLGYKDVNRNGIRVGTQEFIALDVTLEVGAIAE